MGCEKIIWGTYGERKDSIVGSGKCLGGGERIPENTSAVG